MQPKLEHNMNKYFPKMKKVFTNRVLIQSSCELIVNKKEEYSVDLKLLPFFSSCISAGFPSPADDYIDSQLDLNSYLIKHPSATFFVRVKGESMINAGIYNNDILIVDRSLESANGKIVIASIDGQLTVKRLLRNKDKIILNSENDLFEPIEFIEGEEVIFWGVVTSVIHFV